MQRLEIVMWVRYGVAAFTLGAVIFGPGCRPDTARLDRSDRETPLFRKAVVCEKEGNLDEAIRLYGQVLLDHARQAAAHLQLALLLHDHRQDYTAAIYHYQRYLDLRPDTEKRELIQNRIRIAEQLLAAQLLRRVGGDVAGAAQAKQVAENEKLNKRIVALEGERSALQDAKAEYERQIKTLTADVERLRRLVERMQMPPAAAAVQPVRSSVLPRLARSPAPEPQPPPREQTPPPAAILVPPPVAERAVVTAGHSATGGVREAVLVVDAPVVRARAEAEMLPEPVSDPVKDSLVAPRPLELPVPPAVIVNDAVRADDEPLLRDAPAPPAASPRRPAMQTYVVQPGDTLYGIAEKFYGDPGQWKKLRDANRSRIDPDGRVRAGQILLVP